jgi:hypothetical protein
MKDFTNEPCGYKSLSSTNMQIAHFVSRFKRNMKDFDSFILDNLGNIVKERPAREWKIYDTLDEMLKDNTEVVSTGDRTHYFSFVRSGRGAFAVARIN